MAKPSSLPGMELPEHVNGFSLQVGPDQSIERGRFRVAKINQRHIRSDNGPAFRAQDLRKRLADTGAKTLYIEPGSPWQNGYCESFNSKPRGEFFNGEIFYSIKELRVLVERWRVQRQHGQTALLSRLQTTDLGGMADF